MNDSLCKACGDPVTRRFRNDELCEECYDELANGRIRCERANLDSSGRGCPLEPSDVSAGAWQENAIRQLEG